MQLLNDAEAQASGTVVTTSNTGDANSDAFDEVQIGAAMDLVFGTEAPADGTRNYRLGQTTATPAITYAGWSPTMLGGTFVTLYGSVTFTIHTTVASSVRWLDFMSGTSLVARLGLTNGLQGVQWRTALDASSGTASGTLAADTKYTCLFQVTANGTAMARVLNFNTGVQVGADTSPAANYTGTTFNRFRWGMNTANFQTATTGQYITHDAFNLNDQGLPGLPPYTKGPVTPPAVILPDDRQPHRFGPF